MIAHVEQPDGATRTEDRTPVCGKDFCDRCGDCLECYGGFCFDGSEEFEEHLWVIYRGRN